jgi:Leucine-rich repeat (LRR) protein
LPDEIGNLKKLEELKLNYNDLTELPATIGNLASLEYLYLDHNQLTHLPPEIGKLSNLGLFYVGKNSLEDLPVEMGNLTSLSELDLASSGVMLTLPESLCNILGLQLLAVDRTAIVPYCLQGNRNPRFNIIVK